jgi:WD40 repeat protein
MQLLTKQRGEIHSLSFSADGNYLAASSGQDTRISLWYLPRSKRTMLRSPCGHLYYLAFAPRGTALAGASAAGICLWSDPSLTTATSLCDGTHIAFRTDGAILAIVSGGFLSGAVLFVEVATQMQYGTARPLPVRGSWILAVAWSPVGPYLAAAGWYSAVILLQVAPPGPLRKLEPFDGEPRSLSFSPDGKTLAVGTTTGIFRWDIETQEPLPALREHRPIFGLGYLPDGRLLSASSTAGTVRLWDDASGKVLDERDWQIGPLTALAIAPDGMRAAVGNGKGTILIWDID